MNIRILIFTNEKDTKQILEAIDQLQENPKFMHELKDIVKKMLKEAQDDKK